MYLVTVENNDDGIWFDEPAGFDSVAEARLWAGKQHAPADHSVVIYSCREIEVLGGIDGETEKKK